MAVAPNDFAALLANLNDLGIQLEAEGERLRFRPCEKVTPELACRLKAHKAALLELLQRPKNAKAKPQPILHPRAPALASAAHPEAWFRVGATAPRRERFGFDRETKTHPEWWDYLYELHKRGLILVNGIVRNMLYACF